MILTPEELHTVRRVAVEEYPRESCGVVVVRGEERRLVRCRNIQNELHAKEPARYPRDARTAYYIDPKDLLRIGRLEDEGFTVAVIFHSHVDAGAYFSETDRRQALVGGEPSYPAAIYLVTSVVGGRPEAMAAFRWDAATRDFLPVDLGAPSPSVGEPSAVSASKRLYSRAERLMPGGVNSPVRAFRGVGGEPFFVARAEGARLWDVEGHAYIDFVGSWGPLILGHAPRPVVEAIIAAAPRGTSYGAPTPGEVELAEAITAAYPSMEMVRLVSSGTEAAMSAIRLARGATGRDVVMKFDGCYHGHADSLLVKAGSGGATFGIPDSGGVPAPLAALTVTVPFNDLPAVAAVFRERGDRVAAVIVEPIAGNMGVVPPLPGFLEGLRELTTAHGALLIFDEVITGFRVAYGGAQALYGVRPDLTCLGKIIGGGLPVGAYGGRRDLMGRVAPLGDVYQAGTLSGNPLAVAAGLATLAALRQGDAYARLEALSAQLERGLRAGAEKAGVPLVVNRVGSMLTAFFCGGRVIDYASARRADTARYARYFHAMLERGVYLAPSQFEAAFVSLAHSEADIEHAARAAADASASLALA
ncbi:MAG: glutamate-1-semialdehyde 2,1-aminomutase [Candidatus Rokubacteria bacterium]|nr:glutamate-1-semialdehyde 2,1-aminomutase [Candidatus Rokubacteria bacterium]